MRLIDDEHPAPGLLVPGHWDWDTERPSRIRYLGGAHDIDAFVNDATREVIAIARAFHAEITRGLTNRSGSCITVTVQRPTGRRQ